MQATIIKPWGREVILTPTDSPYTVKIIEVKAGLQLSLQYHDQKTETIVLISGDAQIYLNNRYEKMELDYGYHIKPGTIHRIKANTDIKIFEASTPPTGTTFRLEDDYARPNESLS